ncbi:SGNH/GDSL hydrolase family protein [Rhodococcus pyridinivorans]|uniref:SGNH/GDSL hydrolase family protein n=1 Tax=Rhodococcus pyridinivorans TaxID=103816 RepID=UPI0012FE1FF4|nr:SGNH/GDSL hydrolase family protein [Rhodococcus pyridinivorans]
MTQPGTQPASKRLLTEAAGNATYVRSVNGQTVDENGNVVVSGGSPVAAALPTFAGFMRAIEAGQSAALSAFGDSTGESDGSNPATDRTIARFTRRLAEAFPSHHVMQKLWNHDTQGFGPWVAINGGHTDGRRHAIITTRSLRHIPTVPANAKFSTGIIDVRALIAPNTLTPATPQSIVSRNRKGGAAGPWTNDLQFDFRWYTDGKLSIRHSENGTSFLSDRISTVAVPVAAGSQIWVRATVEITPGTGFVAKFYTSADGVTWEQLGANVSGGGAATAPLYASADDSFFEIGGIGWQPVANSFAGKVYEVQIRDGLNGPMIAPAAIEVWERYGDPATTYGGAPTVYVLNVARGGSGMSYHTDPARLKLETPDYGQTALIFNDSHNENTASGSTWIPPYEAWVAAVKGRLPNGAVNVVGQNPHTSAWPNEAAYGQEHVKRVMELSAAASRLGWGFINIYQAFLDGNLAELISSDGLHPTPTGYALGGDTIARAAGLAV